MNTYIVQEQFFNRDVTCRITIEFYLDFPNDNFTISCQKTRNIDHEFKNIGRLICRCACFILSRSCQIEDFFELSDNRFYFV